ncbi:MAG: sulfide/dihydroorotate dehydrogenase-like FAD/NAD-binding protein [Candidatus Omnitrophica bacterium]|nr:sulfide/dihydroorotate dehydrogenase-like FAD/NAD-binding protein [Candidatus Omnitrophota bacterium]
MHKITRKEQLNPEICLVEFKAPDLAKAAEAGQFVILRIDETGERFPLTLYDWDSEKGTVTVVCQAVGVSTKKLCALEVGDSILDAVGPLGHATETRDIGKVICIGGGVGTAEAYPIARAMKESGNDVTVIIGARTKDLVICEDDIRQFCDDVYITTDDGSYGEKGFVTDVLKRLLEKEEHDLVFAIGPVIMMKAVSDLTRESEVRTLVSLNSIMIDGTGMCGGCRLLFDGKPKFACVDGPEFDAHLVDFADLMKRGDRYKDKETEAASHYEEQCKIGLKKNNK